MVDVMWLLMMLVRFMFDYALPFTWNIQKWSEAGIHFVKMIELKPKKADQGPRIHGVQGGRGPPWLWESQKIVT